jgi:hypothetical protein
MVLLGNIHPKKLIQAQIKLFKMNNGNIINDTVISCEKNIINNHIEVNTLLGYKYITKKILIAAGSFTFFFNLIENKLDLILKGESVLLVEISKDDAKLLSNLPSLLCEMKTDKLEGIYLIQPLYYPEASTSKRGRYIKMGCNTINDQIFTNVNEIQEWFKSGNSDINIPFLKNAFEKIMPNINVLSYTTKRCLLTRTPTKRQYIGKIDNNIYVATDGNGYSAMCSDNIVNYLVI